MLRVMALLRCRPAAVLLVAAAIVVQAFLAGLAAAGGARVAMLGASEFAVICHGATPADQGNRTAPDPSGAKHPCCMSCTAAASILGGPPNILLPLRRDGFAPRVPTTHARVAARRAVRAGLSQAPPT